MKLFRIVEENNNIEELNCSPLEGHTYSVNHVEFSNDGTMLASCSLDGGTVIWNPEVSTDANMFARLDFYFSLERREN